MEKKVQTVLGGVSPDELGVVLPHEHLLVDFSKGLTPPSTLPNGTNLYTLPLTLENMGLIWRFPYSVRDNLVLDEMDKAEREVELYKLSGGGTICEQSVVGVRREGHSVEDLKHISLATGVHIVASTGYYCDRFLPDWARALSVQDMADFMTEELVKGVGNSEVKCGVMYIGCSYPLTETEHRALEAAAITHKRTGAAILIHPAKTPESPFEILDVLCSHGVPTNVICMSHMDRTFASHKAEQERMHTLCQRGCYVNHSLFGKECSHYQGLLHFDFPSDAQRIQRVKGLIAGGYLDRVLISHDIVCRHEWTSYGGNGYAHLLEHIAPKFLDRGVQQYTVDVIMKENPKKWLTCSN